MWKNISPPRPLRNFIIDPYKLCTRPSPRDTSSRGKEEERVFYRFSGVQFSRGNFSIAKVETAYIYIYIPEGTTLSVVLAALYSVEDYKKHPRPLLLRISPREAKGNGFEGRSSGRHVSPSSSSSSLVRVPRFLCETNEPFPPLLAFRNPIK